MCIELECSADTVSAAFSVTVMVAAEKGLRVGGLHLKLCILFARATSEITNDIHVQCRERRRLLYASAALEREVGFNNLYGTSTGTGALLSNLIVFTGKSYQ